MIKLIKLTKNVPHGDYVLEKEDQLRSTIVNLTPMFKGRWNIVMIDPSIDFTLKLIDDSTFPEWIDVIICTNVKKLDRIVEVKPAFAPKEETVYEAYTRAVMEMNHMIDTAASKYLYASLRNNKELLISTLQKLDMECTKDSIELQDVQAEVVKPNIVWASTVVDAFLTGNKQRWKLYSKLISDAGITIAYYATKKYVNRLLDEKNKYLHGEEVQTKVVSKVPASSICLLYYLIATTNNPKLLSSIYVQLDNRSNYNLEED